MSVVEVNTPLLREDGNPLTQSDILGYRIYYGESAGDYQDVIDVGASSLQLDLFEQLPSGTYFVVVTTVDLDGRESLYSPETVVSF